MLELKGIKKDYLAGENTVHALKGIDLKFRQSEFVAILGPSGCGKTTMLNIIGGLDQYTEGDLIINGRSTKEYKDRDWDAYRNHSIGFVFQSYNLIPHQTVLRNVELALTLSGVSKNERVERAKKALEKVGLGNQFNKRPSEMSGGQMQRVAIARAIVNDPDIILADEPTGALDTVTSEQVMDILKDISKDRLVIMVTHNPELAEKYSTRIVRMLDGVIQEDSAPLTEKEIQMEEVRDKTLQDEEAGVKKKKPSMSFITSVGLSMKNLFTKKGRTMLTSFAGSIGIIGIALIYAVSQGFQNYIDDIQEETLSSYPLAIEHTNTDLSAIMETFMKLGSGDIDHGKDAVYKRSAIYEIVNAFNDKENSENDLKSFKAYIEEQKADEESKLHGALNGVQYAYDYDMLVYTKNVDGDIIISDAEQLMTELMADAMNIDMSAMSSMSSGSMMGGMMGSSMQMKLWQEMLAGDNGKKVSPLLEKQYDVVYGSWPNSYDEVVLVLDKNNELNDVALYALGLETKEEIDQIMTAAMDGKTKVEFNQQQWSYEDICNRTYRVVLNSDCFKFDKSTNTYSDLRDTEAGMTYLYDNGIDIKVSGIIRPSEDSKTAMLTGAIAYTGDLTRYIIENSQDADVIKAQLDTPEKDVISGLPFKPAAGSLTDEEKQELFRTYVNGKGDTDKTALYVQLMSTPKQEELAQMTAEAMKDVKREDMETALVQMLTQQMGVAEDDIRGYLSQMSDDDLTAAYTQGVQEQIKAQYAQQVMEQLGTMEPAQMLAALDQMMKDMKASDAAYFYDEIVEFSNATYEDNLRKMGYIDLDDPSMISLYSKSFEKKDVIEDVIKDYNEGKDELDTIKYTDYIGLMMSSITTIINAITYVLIAFVSISLIVSSIMIGVITLISVQERTKEIGILRAIGASKRNVSNMFNAETMLIGFTSGLLGVIVSWLATFPINAIIEGLTGITNLKSVLPLPAAVILIMISVMLTLISGIIPSRSAAKKDPVVALRTE
ncbi:MAG: ATP-binding cassette domain-containing protein [Ruminococcus sp.]|nr:ATP-binding cassette domain-containing protein [Ruminococcus sp.]